MEQKVKNLFTRKNIEQLVDPRNLVLYIFTIIVLAMTWSGVKTIQRNYELQKQIAKLQQENTVLELSNQNSDLQNKYLASDQYLDLAARRELGLAAPGETVKIVPKDVALKYIDPTLIPKTEDQSSSISASHHGATENIKAWRDFLLGRKVTVD